MKHDAEDFITGVCVVVLVAVVVLVLTACTFKHKQTRLVCVGVCIAADHETSKGEEDGE